MENVKEHICILCGEKHKIEDMTLLGEIKGMFGRDLGYVCQKCINHIDKMEYFERIGG